MGLLKKPKKSFLRCQKNKYLPFERTQLESIIRRSLNTSLSGDLIMTHLPDRPFLKSLLDKYDFSYVLEHYFDDNGVKDSAPEELKAEFKDVEFRRYPENGCL